MTDLESSAKLVGTKTATKRLDEAVQKHQALKAKAAKAAAAVEAMKAAANETARRREVAVLIKLGRFLCSRAEEDQAFARYCADQLANFPFTKNDATLMCPVIDALHLMGRAADTPAADEGEATDPLHHGQRH